jgi:hypothetical protein
MFSSPRRRLPLREFPSRAREKTRFETDTRADACLERKRNDVTERETRCPVCGLGELVDLLYTEGPGDEEMQRSDTRQVATYSCGHERVGPSLEESTSPDSTLDVEHRTSDETVDPPTDADG